MSLILTRYRIWLTIGRSQLYMLRTQLVNSSQNTMNYVFFIICVSESFYYKSVIELLSVFRNFRSRSVFLISLDDYFNWSSVLLLIYDKICHFQFQEVPSQELYAKTIQSSDSIWLMQWYYFCKRHALNTDIFVKKFNKINSLLLQKNTCTWP